MFKFSKLTQIKFKYYELFRRFGWILSKKISMIDSFIRLEIIFSWDKLFKYADSLYLTNHLH